MWTWHGDWNNSWRADDGFSGRNKYQGQGTVGSVKDGNGRYRKATAKRYKKRVKRSK